ncbi:adenosine-specific kinase [Oceanithermus sp.]
MELLRVEIEKPEELNVIIGQSHFIKTVEDVHEALVQSAPGIKFGLAFNEASQDRLVRKSGTDAGLVELAVKNALRVGAGHFLIIVLGEGFYPINVMPALRTVPELVGLFAATANPVSLLVAEEGDQRAVLGVFDGLKPLGVEGPEDEAKRLGFLRMIGYKLGG